MKVFMKQDSFLFSDNFDSFLLCDKEILVAACSLQMLLQRLYPLNPPALGRPEGQGPWMRGWGQRQWRRGEVSFCGFQQLPGRPLL